MVNLVGMKRRKNSSEVSMKETTTILMDILRGNLQDYWEWETEEMGEFEL